MATHDHERPPGRASLTRPAAERGLLSRTQPANGPALTFGHACSAALLVGCDRQF